MSGTNSNSPPGAGGGGDPSMEDILASIRRILAEDEPAPQEAITQDAEAPPAEGDEVLVLDSTMRTGEEAAAEPPKAAAEKPAPAGQPKAAAEPAEVVPLTAKPTPAPAPAKVEPVAPAGTQASGGQRAAARQADQKSDGFTSLEDAVRQAFEPAIKDWMDATLPKIVERMVRVEVERIVGGAVR